MRELTLEKYRRALESKVEAGGHTFVVRRPTCADVAEISGRPVSLEWAAQFVVGWEGVVESDLIPGGDPEPVAFSSPLFLAWVKDRPSLWAPITEGVITAYQRYEEAAAERGKL